MQSIQTQVDALAMVGVPLADDEVIFYVLNGLSFDFKEIGATIHVWTLLLPLLNFTINWQIMRIF